MLTTDKRQTKNMIPIESKERTEMVKYETWLLTNILFNYFKLTKIYQKIIIFFNFYLIHTSY